MFNRLGNFVSRRWLLVILFWIALVVLIRIVAPAWDDVTHDGDFAYLPSDMPSVEGQRWLSEAFPKLDSKSEFVLIVARERGPERDIDRFVAFDLARRFENIQGAELLARARELWDAAGPHGSDGPDDDDQRRLALESLAESAKAIREAIRMDESLAAYFQQRTAADAASAGNGPDRLAAAYHNSALLLEFINQHGLRDEIYQLYEPADHDLQAYLDARDAATDRDLARQFDPTLDASRGQLNEVGLQRLPIHDVLTFASPQLGEKLRDRRQGHGLDETRARLIVVQLNNEFMATDNLRVRQRIDDEIAPVRRWIERESIEGLEIGVSGSAAVGSDLLLASKESIANTELIAILLVTVILICVYRSPVLVAVPLVTIMVSLLVATSLIALLTQVVRLPGMEWWDFKVFKTTKIFIVVILYGAGTDYCLFLISRYREELAGGEDRGVALSRALAAVGDALAASALTTIVGLAMMFFADFGKFRNSGPAIGLCLAVTLLACVTLAPALLRGLGRVIFWPFGSATPLPASAVDSRPRGNSRFLALWRRVARTIVVYPGRILIVCFALLSPLAWLGLSSADHVTYDVLSSLDADQPSRLGAELLRNHFPVGESGPIVVLAKKDGTDFLPDEVTGPEDYAGQNAIWQLTKRLHSVRQFRFALEDSLRDDLQERQVSAGLRAAFAERQVELSDEAVLEPTHAGREWRIVDVDGSPDLPGWRTFIVQQQDSGLNVYTPAVRSVRSFATPLGEPPGDRSYAGLRTVGARSHDKVQARYITQVPALQHNVTRFEIVLTDDAFSLDAARTLDLIDTLLQRESEDDSSYWAGTQFGFTGTTAAIRDLRTVTRADSSRIEVLVVLAVFVVLLIILRRPVVCLYMILSVLFTYYVTIGATELFFRWMYGDTFQGLDWKLPLFLFVILVAIGQDYNVYLATRVFEEQSRLGPFAGLKRAVVSTGGIITSCGVIMAGTFISMTSGTWGYVIPDWLPLSETLFPRGSGALRGIVELGFALSLGVLLDTFIVRPILLPSFLALLCRWKARGSANRRVRPRPTAL